MKEVKKNSGYSGKNIQELSDMEHIRRRAGMYVGVGKSALIQIFYEIITNSFDEALAGHCNKIEVTLDSKNTVTIKDNGRGMPWDMTTNEDGEKVPACILCCTSLKAGGKFDTKAYAVSAGSNGVGIKAVNALSEYFRLETHRDGKAYYFECKKGNITKGLTLLDKNCKDTGTIVTFRPDHELDMFTGESTYDEKDLLEICKFSAYLNPAKIIFNGPTKKEKFYFEDGAFQFVTDLANKINKENKTKNLIKDPILIKGKQDNVEVDIALLYTSAGGEYMNSFVNGIRTKQGGTHLTGTKLAISKVITSYINQKKMLEGRNKNVEVTGDDCRDGLIAFVAVRLPEPKFQGQVKDELGSREAQGACQKLVGDALKELFDTKPETARAICAAVIAAARGRMAAKRAKEVARKEVLDSNGLGLSAKLKDCISNNPDECEIFLCEGNSAAGSITDARDVNTQAVLPFRGKILNTYGIDINRMMDNVEINSLISALGTGIGNSFDYSKLRYKKIILTCDSDVDGDHITCLFMTFFFKWLREIVENGNLFIARPPLYLIKKGAKIVGFLETEKDKEEFIKEHGNEGYQYNYIKGLGELNPEDLGFTTIDKKNRRLIQVTIEDAEAAEEQLRVLMDNKAVDERKEFIEQNASEATLDV